MPELLVASEFLRLLFDELGLLMKLNEYGDLAAQNFRDNVAQNVIHRAERITSSHMVIRLIDGSDKNNGSVLRTRTFADKRSGFKAVHAGYGNVQQDNGEILMKQLPKRILAGTCLHEVLPKRREHGLQCEQLVFAVIHDK